MYCMRCGTVLAEGTAFCGACGQAANAPATVASTPASSATPPGPAPSAVAPIPRPLPSPFAGFWLRFVAHLIDEAVVAAACGIFVLAALAFLGIGFFRASLEGLRHENADQIFPAFLFMFILIFVFAVVLAMWLYYAWMESSPSQATLGKMALGLIVTDMEGKRISFGRASGRFFAKLITGLIPLLIGYIMAGFTEKKQALHDMIASCVVLRKI